MTYTPFVSNVLFDICLHLTIINSQHRGVNLDQSLRTDGNRKKRLTHLINLLELPTQIIWEI